MIGGHQTAEAVAVDRVSTILDPYPITEVSQEWVRGGEEMGSKRKFWYVCPGSDEETEWLFKYPQSNTGQHWSEKIAAEVAAVLEIPHARVELAVFSEDKGIGDQIVRRQWSRASSRQPDIGEESSGI